MTEEHRRWKGVHGIQFVIDRAHEAGRCDHCQDYGGHGELFDFVAIGNARLCPCCAALAAGHILHLAGIHAVCDHDADGGPSHLAPSTPQERAHRMRARRVP